jgi:DNA-binding transcriptional ArsR family regulator
MKQVIVMWGGRTSCASGLEGSSVDLVRRTCFVYHRTMDAEVPDADNSADVSADISTLAAAIAEPARTRMLFCLMDGHARTSTELAVVAGVSPSTASVHLARLKEQRLVKVLAQGKHRYHSLADASVAAALEALSVVAGGSSKRFVPNTPMPLRNARTCYDHMAGALAVALHDRCHELGWLTVDRADASRYELTEAGTAALEALGVDVQATRLLRRRFACACVDWSERRPHLGGALGAALLGVALKRRWVTQDADTRALTVTRSGRRELEMRFHFGAAPARMTALEIG